MSADAADYIVLRAPLVPGFAKEGWWLDLRTIPGRSPKAVGLGIAHISETAEYLAVPMGTFEVREDGAVAEVWEVRRV